MATAYQPTEDEWGVFIEEMRRRVDFDRNRMTAQDCSVLAKWAYDAADALHQMADIEQDGPAAWQGGVAVITYTETFGLLPAVLDAANTFANERLIELKKPPSSLSLGARKLHKQWAHWLAIQSSDTNPRRELLRQQAVLRLRRDARAFLFLSDQPHKRGAEAPRSSSLCCPICLGS